MEDVPGPTACLECGTALPAGARFCPSCAAPVELRAHEDERKVATVLFADLVGSTELAGSQDPEHTRAVLDRFYETMADEIGAAGGTIEKFAGDAVMAAFGAPAAYEDHAERALSAAVAMQERLAELFGDALRLRVGVNTGQVVVGEARVGSSFASGDPVNVAARLEQAATPGEILVGERTAAAARHAFAFDEPLTIPAKGKPEGVACRRLVGRLSEPVPRGASGRRSAFVGRVRELDALRAAHLRAVEAARPELVVVVGEAGVGKTRLVEEALEQLGETPEPPRILTGRCVPYGRGSTYWPLASVLRSAFGLGEDDPRDAVLARLRGREIMAVTLGLDVAAGVHPRVVRARLHDAWRVLFEELAAERPLTLVVEDLHWAEQPLLDLLGHLSAAVSGALLVVGTTRHDLEWAPDAPSSVVVVPPLSAADAERIVACVAGELPPSIRDLVVERAEGNPFFVEEFLGMLVDRGLLVTTNGGWTAPEPTGLELPDSIQSVLAARIDLLSGDEKAALQAASVVGRHFWTAPVRALLGGAEPQLAVLVTRDLIRRRSTSSLAGEVEYAFKHALTRDVAYGGLTRARRARLHAGFARWLEETGRDGDEHAPLLAHHYAEAVDPEFAELAWPVEGERERLRRRAVAWLRRAAELAATRYAIDESLGLLDRAFALETDRDERIGILSQKGRAHIARFDPQGFREAMEQALALGPTPSAEAEIYARLAYYGVGRPYMWKQPPPPELGRSWLARALEVSEPSSEARGYALLARALSEPAAGTSPADEAFALARQLGNPALTAFACEAQALAATSARSYDDACEWADRALTYIHELSDPGLIGHQYWNAGFVYLRAGRVAEVRRLAEACAGAAAALNPHEAVHALALQLLLESVLGRWEALAELAENAEAATAANEDFPCQFNWRNLLVCALGFAYAGNGRDESQRLVQLGRELAVVAGPPEREPALLRLALRRGELDDARRILEALPPGIDAFGLDAPAARLDALAALGEARRVEEEAAQFVGHRSYTRPFALRALGFARGDASLVSAAEREFEAMGLAWRAQETRALAE